MRESMDRDRNKAVYSSVKMSEQEIERKMKMKARTELEDDFMQFS